MIDLVSIATLGLLAALLIALLEASRRGNVAVAVNAAVALVVALLPAAVELRFGVALGPTLPLWLAVAGLLHTVGMFGLYESVPWWDHLTHVVSAALVAALFHASLLASGLSVPVSAATVLFTFVVGLFWEFLELIAREAGERFDIEPVLVHYGRRDTALDLGFDVVGAVLVVFVDPRVFVPVVAAVPVPVRSLVLGSSVAVVVGTIAVAVLVAGLRIGR